MANLLLLHQWFINFARQKRRMPELAKEDFYYSEEGYIVFTKQYHLKRGYCCQSGCKHCPYGFDKKTGTFRK